MMLLPTLCRAAKAPSRTLLRNAALLAQSQQKWQRPFTSTSRAAIAVAEMSERDLASIKVKQDRLMKDIHDTCEWGKGEAWGDHPTETGMSRLSLSDTDKQARDWFVETCKSLGCKITIDNMGNTYAVRPGLDNDAPPTYAGSHLDTQPTGGRYDGILGVTAAVEMLRTLNDNWIETTYPVGVVNWTNEEGARFPISMVSSGVWSGDVPLERAHNLRSVIPASDTATLKSELERIGYLGDFEASHKAVPMAAHFELHIEQGPILEAEGRKVGVVRGVQAYRWFTVSVRGRDCHTGTTSFQHRADALLAASKMILYSHRAAVKAGAGALASSGILTLKPGSTNTVPGTVDFSLDIRAPEDKTVEEVEEACKRAFAQIAQGENVDGLNEGTHPSDRQCTVNWRTDSVSPANPFHEDCIQCVTDAGNALFETTDKADEAGNIGTWGKHLTSGAGHDSVYTSKRVPTSMVFCPSKDGVSHHPAEYSKPEDCGIGAQVLMGAVLRYDKLRAERSN